MSESVKQKRRKQKRRKRELQCATEDEEQISLIQWAAYNKAAHPELKMLIHIANERKCSAAQGARLKKMGVRKGMPDLFLFSPAGDRHGLAIEMKRERGGRVSDDQKTMLTALERQGYAVCVARGWATASEVILDYLSGGSLWKEYCGDLQGI